MKFKCFPSIEIFEEIRLKKYVEFTLINGVHHYSLTLGGKELIEKEYQSTYDFLLNNFPKESEFIKNIFAAYKKM